jgi:hypothetical protein
MSSLIISGDTSGNITVAAPAVAGTNTLTLQAATATNAVNTLATAVASTSGTSIEFTSLPSWIKRITLQWSGVSTNGTSNLQVQLGTGSTTYTTSGYNCISTLTGAGSATTAASTGFVVVESAASASSLYYGTMVITNITGNTWVATSQFGLSTRNVTIWSSGSIALGSTLTAIRTTTVNGTDTFDAGTINILYEG